MKILIASNSFKNSLSAIEACNAIKEGFYKNYPSVKYDLCPISDGGDGTCEVLGLALNAKMKDVCTTGPLNEKIMANYGIEKDKKIAIIEIAKAAGMTLLNKEQLNPLKTTTYGAGKLVLDALDNGAKVIIFGVGGTATNDGGMGLLNALGVRFYDKDDKELNCIGESLIKVNRIDISHLDKRIKDCKFIIANDVNNKLYGPEGAAYVYAKQKGADDKMIKQLDDGLINYAKVLDKMFNCDCQSIEGGGSGGGLGIALKLFFNASLESGFNLVKDTIGLEDRIKNSDLIITGEGNLDKQSKNGKGPIGVARLAKKYQKQVYAIVGNMEKGISFDELDKIYSLAGFNKDSNLDDLINNGYIHLKELASNIKI